jgi:hypothetical protein
VPVRKIYFLPYRDKGKTRDRQIGSIPIPIPILIPVPIPVYSLYYLIGKIPCALILLYLINSCISFESI